MQNTANQKRRLGALELRRGELRKEIEDRMREIQDIERDARILAEAIEAAEAPADEDQPDQTGEKVN